MKTNGIKVKPTLEQFSHREDDVLYWYASWYAEVLGYKSIRTFWPSIKKAKEACVHLDIPIEKNFIAFKGSSGKDMKLSKFACFLVALHADGRKPIVKRARSFFLNELEEVNLLVDEQEFLDRNIASKQLKLANKKFAIAGRRARVKDFQYFINEGYMGMYNSITTEMKRNRGIAVNADISKFMGVTELAANIFRLTLTSERLKRLKNPSEEKAARAHWRIGLQIRSMIKESTGSYPEDLPLKPSLQVLQTKLQSTQKFLNSDLGLIGNS